jgi:hypothetical protein
VGVREGDWQRVGLEGSWQRVGLPKILETGVVWVELGWQGTGYREGGSMEGSGVVRLAEY